MVNPEVTAILAPESVPAEPPSWTWGGPIPDRVTLLADVAEIVSRSHDLDETLSNVVDLVAKRLGADACSIYLIGADLTKLTLSATIGLYRESIGRVELPIGESRWSSSAPRSTPATSTSRRPARSVSRR